MNKIAQQIRYVMPAKDSSLQQKILLGVLGLAVTGGAIYFGRKWYLKNQTNREETKSFEDGTPATIAKQLKMAFENDGWPGTNTPAVRNALREIATKEAFKQVALSYQKLYNSNLMADLSSELQSSEYTEMINIIGGKPSASEVVKPKSKKKNTKATKKTNAKESPKPVTPSYPFEGWAKRLKAAFDKKYGFLPGTDEDAITAVITEIPTQAVFAQTALVYQRLYTTKFLDDLKSESEFGEYSGYMAIVSKKPKR